MYNFVTFQYDKKMDGSQQPYYVAETSRDGTYLTGIDLRAGHVKRFFVGKISGEKSLGKVSDKAFVYSKEELVRSLNGGRSLTPQMLRLVDEDFLRSEVLRQWNKNISHVYDGYYVVDENADILDVYVVLRNSGKYTVRFNLTDDTIKVFNNDVEVSKKDFVTAVRNETC